jgi:signal peptidase I
VRPLPLDGSTAPTMPAWLRRLGYLLLVLTTVLVLGVGAASKFSPVRFFSVTSGSMVPTLPVGTITAIDTAQRTPRVGEIVAFHPPGDPTQVFTHRIVAVLAHGMFKTEGDALHVRDPWTVAPADVVGRVVGWVPYAAWVMAVLKAAVLLTLLAYMVRLVLRRIFGRRTPPVLWCGMVLVGSLLYLLDLLRPMIGGGAQFLGVSGRMMRVVVINTGWIPLHAFSMANPAARTPAIAPNSALLTRLDISGHAHLRALTAIKLVPALSPVDYAVLALVVFSPFLLAGFGGSMRSRSAR